MRKNLFGSSLIEVIIVMMIIVVGVIGAYSIFASSMKLSTSSQNRLQAIQIAREGIEAMMNIRDTNTLIFSANLDNCWNTFNYNQNCVTSLDNSTDISTGFYTIYKNTDNRWYLTSLSTGNYSDSSYRNNFKVMLDNNGFYTQTGSFSDTKPLFTREIKITYSSLDEMNIISLVNWVDSSSTQVQKVELNTILTNWKKN